MDSLLLSVSSYFFRSPVPFRGVHFLVEARALGFYWVEVLVAGMSDFLSVFPPELESKVREEVGPHFLHTGEKATCNIMSY